MSRGKVVLALGLACLSGTVPARASGVEHVVDDADVETAGLCHLESYFSHSRAGEGLYVASPACTRRAWPNLEIGGFVSHGWTPSDHPTLIGLAPKLRITDSGNRLRFGIKGTLGYGTAHGRPETAALIAPVTFDISKRLSVNADVGWQWLRGQGHSAFFGSQIEFQATKRLEVMGEMFGRAGGRLGVQAGLRWTVARDRVDLDLAYGRYVDGTTPHAVTLGMAIRFGGLA